MGIMQSAATTVTAYIAELPAERQAAIKAVRAVIRKNLPKGFAEQMQYGMIGYVVPHKLYPAGYHCKPTDPLPFACLASQKNHMSLYLMTAYGWPGMADWIKEQFAARGKKLDMGKSCIRFKKLEDIPLDVIGEAIGKVPVADYIRHTEATLKR
jgi:uncharacterized protein YdhG (YjbR/CyaY superfamily)